MNRVLEKAKIAVAAKGFAVLALAGLAACTDTDTVTLGATLQLTGNLAGTGRYYRDAYQFAVDRLAVPAQAIAFVSSNGWDACAASAFGLQVVWCNRNCQPRERLPGAPAREVRSLAEMPVLLGLS